jgi:hypothetical protein
MRQLAMDEAPRRQLVMGEAAMRQLAMDEAAMRQLASKRRQDTALVLRGLAVLWERGVKSGHASRKQEQ